MTTTETAYYLRQSLDRDENQLAIDRQRDDLLKLCDRLGWADPVEYCDNNVSASKGTRPAYERLCRDIADGVIVSIAVWDMDRLHRQPRELEGFIDLVERHHVELANVGGSVDLSTPSGRYFARTRGAAARFEVEHKAERQKAANRQRAKAGKAWNARSFGWKGDKLVAREANAIRKASRDLLNGASLWSIAAQWNTQGLKTVKGGTWTGSTVRQVLARASNAGLAVYDVKGHKNPQDAILEGVQAARPAIVDRDTWEGVCTLLADPKRHTGKSPGRKHLLSGIAICDACDRPMGTGVRSTGRAVYCCKRLGCMAITRDLALTDQRVIDAVTKRLAKPDAAVTLARPTVDAKALRDQIELLRGKIREAEGDYDNGQITAARMNARIERTEAKLAPLQAKLLGSSMSADVKALAGKPDAAKRFAALPLDRRRGVIDTLATVTIHALNRPGGKFDPAAITVDFERTPRS
jgi:site-specific DNA recombinase